MEVSLPHIETQQDYTRGTKEKRYINRVGSAVQPSDMRWGCGQYTRSFPFNTTYIQRGQSFCYPLLQFWVALSCPPVWIYPGQLVLSRVQIEPIEVPLQPSGIWPVKYVAPWRHG